MSPTVLSVAYPFAPVGPDAVGGAEQVLATIDRCLHTAGARSLVLAAPGSRVAGALIEGPAIPARLDEAARARTHASMAARLAAVVREARVDLVHMHGVDFAAYLPPPGVPTLVTLHLPIGWYDPAIRALPVRLVCVSRAQRALGGAAWADLPVVANGVALPDGPRLRKRDFALALGRICPEKGLDDAVVAARAAGVPLLVAGRVFPYPAHEAYFHEALEPALDARRRFIGPIGGARKRRLLAAARCLVVASRVEETSSLVTMEALAAGTPVVARRIGALPDLLEHGRTGFLVDDVAQMAAAIGRCARLEPEECRRQARARFDERRMVAEYLALYRALAP